MGFLYGWSGFQVDVSGRSWFVSVLHRVRDLTGRHGLSSSELNVNTWECRCDSTNLPPPQCLKQIQPRVRIAICLSLNQVHLGLLIALFRTQQ